MVCRIGRCHFAVDNSATMYLSSQGQTAVPGIRIRATKTFSLGAASMRLMKGVMGRCVREAGNGLITNDKVVTNFREGAYFSDSWAAVIYKPSSGFCKSEEK